MGKVIQLEIHANNKSTKMKLIHGSDEWKNFMKNIMNMKFDKVEVSGVVKVIDKKVVIEDASQSIIDEVFKASNKDWNLKK